MADLGLHFFLGLRPTPDLDPADRELLAAIRPAGIILFRANFDQSAPYPIWHARLQRLLADAKAAIGRERILVGIDHEGGTVLRTPAPITPYSFARSWADRAGAVGGAMAAELTSLGVNVSFSPVVDIDSNPRNPVIGPRAFATTAEGVSAAAIPFVAALQRGGVLACPKHFPGHGDTSSDSHLSLPVLDVDRAALAARELRPFRDVIAAGAADPASAIQLVMTAHISFPRIDPDNPATLSRTILTDILRDELGYEGAVVTDDIGMKAISNRFDEPGTVTQAIAAGSDLVMVCSHWSSTERTRGLLAELEQAAGSSALPERLLDTSRARILRLLRAAATPVPHLLPADELAAHAALAPLRTSSGAVGQTVSLEEG
ncbi:MAG TPA: glycoside hydrolase family 3 N-terminal domain-containing protein [Kofleriaceae bacterium]